MNLFRRFLPKALSQEVIEVFAASPAIKKLGHNDEDDYDFLEILAICREFKGELFRRGIIFAAKDVDCLFEQISEGKNTFTVRCTVRTKFEARRECWFGMQRFDMGEALGAGLDTFDHIALSIAQTFAYKAMLKRSSMTYGEQDETEANRGSRKPKETPHQKGRQLAYQKRAWRDALANSGLTTEQADALLAKEFGPGLNSEVIPALDGDDFEAAMKFIILKHSDMTEQLQRSVEVAKKPKEAQRVVGILDKKVPRAEEMLGD